VSRCGDIPLYTGGFDEITEITGFKLIRGALCAMRRRELPAVEELCRNKKRIAVLENVVNPTNMGAIFRSAAALGMEAVLLTSDCTDPLYRRASRVSMGTVFQVPWTIMKCSSSDYPDLLHSLGFSLAAMALKDNSVDIDDERLNSEEKLAVIMGTEGDGLTDHTIASCDYTVKIPMYNGVDSLNVAAASAVAFWQLGRKRG
jgi:tRNA G18 (ribose-2'-O)-methylase SpoU